MLAAERVVVAHPRRGAWGRPEWRDVIHDVSLAVERGQIVALVGESGCGKTTLARTLVGLIRPRQGRVRWDGVDIAAMSAAQLRAERRYVQMIFQNPRGSLSPGFTVRALLEEALAVHRLAPSPARSIPPFRTGRRDRTGRVAELLDLVGLPARLADRRADELSGGECQRVAIARALAVEPDILVCDEPVSALDVSVQAQVLNLLLDLRDALGLGCLFISHDLAVVAHLADQVAVMQEGRIVEAGPAASLFAQPDHPHTRELLAAVPTLYEHGRPSAQSR